MPLLPGKANIGANIEELKAAGWTNQKQRLAIALSKAGVKKKPTKESGK